VHPVRRRLNAIIQERAVGALRVLCVDEAGRTAVVEAELLLSVRATACGSDARRELTLPNQDAPLVAGLTQLQPGARRAAVARARR